MDICPSDIQQTSGKALTLIEKPEVRFLTSKDRVAPHTCTHFGVDGVHNFTIGLHRVTCVAWDPAFGEEASAQCEFTVRIKGQLKVKSQTSSGIPSILLGAVIRLLQTSSELQRWMEDLRLRSPQLKLTERFHYVRLLLHVKVLKAPHSFTLGKIKQKSGQVSSIFRSVAQISVINLSTHGFISGKDGTVLSANFALCWFILVGKTTALLLALSRILPQISLSIGAFDSCLFSLRQPTLVAVYLNPWTGSWCVQVLSEVEVRATRPRAHFTATGALSQREPTSPTTIRSHAITREHGNPLTMCPAACVSAPTPPALCGGIQSVSLDLIIFPSCCHFNVMITL